MSQTDLQSARSTGRMTTMVAGLIIALMPSGPLPVITSTPWELDVLRLSVIVGVSLIGVWPWASSQERSVVRRLYVWSMLGISSTAFYLISGGSLFLFLAFCLFVGASVDIWTRRAHMASDELRRRLQSMEGDGRAKDNR